VYAEYTRPQLTFLALHPWELRGQKVAEVSLTRRYDYKVRVGPARIMQLLDWCARSVCQHLR